MGVRHSAAGIRKYCQPHTILVTRFAPSKEPTMYPELRHEGEAAGAALVLMYGRKRRGRK